MTIWVFVLTIGLMTKLSSCQISEDDDRKISYDLLRGLLKDFPTESGNIICHSIYFPSCLSRISHLYTVSAEIS